MDTETTLTVEQAYEAAYRLVWQYYGREPSSKSLALMLVAMEPVADYAKTSDPASWPDGRARVAETLSEAPLPHFPRVDERP